LLVCDSHGLLKRVDTLFYVVANKANLCDTANLIVNTMRVFLNNATATRSGSNSCYIFKLLVVNNLLFVRAQYAPPSKKRAKLQQINDICKKIRRIIA
jgi:hypothetical protein